MSVHRCLRYGLCGPLESIIFRTVAHVPTYNLLTKTVQIVVAVTTAPVHYSTTLEMDTK